MRNILLSVLILPLLASCESQPTALDRSIIEYRNSQWLLSEMWAGKSISSNQVISESQYMMGLCEFQRKQIESAEGWFAKAKNSSNKEVSAKATAMLGIIAEHQGDYESAKADFAIASQNLTELQQLGIATTWVTEDTDRSGRILYLVQGGNFNTRTDASRRKGHGDLPQCNITRIN
jgi:TPR repeat protein